MKMMDSTFVFGFFSSQRFDIAKSGQNGPAIFGYCARPHILWKLSDLVVSDATALQLAITQPPPRASDSFVVSDANAQFDLHLRSSSWKHVREVHLHNNPTCASCGSKEGLEVHHVVPFHKDPSMELIPSNLLTLCGAMAWNCHLRFGHLGSWRSWNANIVEDAAKMLAKIKGRP